MKVISQIAISMYFSNIEYKAGDRYFNLKACENHTNLKTTLAVHGFGFATQAFSKPFKSLT